MSSRTATSGKRAVGVVSATLLLGVLIAPSLHPVSAASRGRVKAWGQNGSGQLGDDSSDERHTPVNVQDLSNVKRLSPGCGFAVALKKNGTVYAWGNNSQGQLGNDDAPTNSDVPVQVSGLNNVTAVAAGQAHTLA